MSGTGSDNGWLEAAVAWEVCASLHRQYCKGKDALFTTRQSDFVKHAENARGRASHGQAPAGAQNSVQEDAGGANWQDISTAPKDGTRFVAVGNNYGLYSETQHTCIAQWFRGCWMEASDWNEASELKYLTHWMPLLPLPVSAARKQGEKQ